MSRLCLHPETIYWRPESSGCLRYMLDYLRSWRKRLACAALYACLIGKCDITLTKNSIFQNHDTDTEIAFIHRPGANSGTFLSGI